MKAEILIAGFGGQGILLMGQLLAEAAMNAGRFATWFPSYGPEMRGGTANCTTMISDEEIGSPISAAYDVVVAMNQPSLERFAPRVRAGGALIVNQSMVPIRCDRADITSVYVPASELARQAGNERCANVVMLGALLAQRPVVELERIEEAISGVLGRRKPEAVEANVRALHLGLEAAGRDGLVTSGM